MNTLNYDPTTGGYIFGPLTDNLDAMGGYIVDPSSIRAGERLPSGCGFATVLPDFDFETYSEAGYVFNEDAKKWKSITKSPPHGIGAVGAAAYAEHPSTEVLSMAYNLKDGIGARLWVPGMEPPTELFDHIAAGGLLEAWNSAFEWHIWANVCERMGWPPLPYYQLRDAMAKSRAFSLPGALGKAAKVLEVTDQKIDDGKRLITKFCKPRNPTKKDARRRNRPEEDHEDAAKLYDYNLGDIKSESAVSAVIPDLSADELELWLLDQCINLRGVHIDGEALSNCLAIIEQANEMYTAELVALTDGTVKGAGEIAKITGWLGANGVHMASLDSDHVAEALKRDDLPPKPKRVLQIRASLGAASVKKLFAIDRRRSKDGRLRDLFAFCGADRTGRFAGRGPQPQNLPNSGPAVRRCDPVNGCGKHYGPHLDNCPWCQLPEQFSAPAEWCIEAVEDALLVMASRNLQWVEHYFGDAVAAISGCLRGLFSAAPGCDFLCSDYSAIEAVVLAMLAGEQWRIDVFRTHGKIYEMSAAKISGVPFDEFLRHKKETGDHHPLRKKIGKVAELASGYQGGYGAWLAFGADKHLEEAEIRESIKAWRNESPNIVKFWYGLEDAAVAAVQNPGHCYEYNGITYGVKDDVLYCQLLSGRKLSYHQPRLHPDVTPWGKQVLKLTYMGWNSDYKKGPQGWMRLETYGGKLCENTVQATARDILTYALKNVERAGYAVALHVHDEIVSEVLEGTGSVEEFERVMATMPPWAADWPIRAAGGWRGKRYRKD
jgi:DNA polymerase bacteriophage-type